MDFDLSSAVPIGGQTPVGGTPAPSSGVAPAQPEKTNVFDLTSAKPIGQPTDAQVAQKAQATVIGNSSVNPDQAGQSAVVGRQIGAPQAAVETDLPRYQAQAKAQENASTVATSPKLAKFVADNPDSAKIAQDDLKDMSSVESLFGKSLLFGMNAPTNLDQAHGFIQGLGGAFNEAKGSVNMLLGALPAIYSNVTGNTDVSDWWMKHMVAPSIDNQGAFQPAENAPFSVKAMHTVGNLLGTLSQISLSAPAEIATSADSMVTGMKAVGAGIAHGVKSMAFPALSSAVNTGQQVYEQTGDMNQAIKAMQMQYVTSTAGGVVPIGAPGSLATRLVTGAVSGVATGEVSRQAMNLVNPKQTPFSGENLALSALSSSILGGVMGGRPLDTGVRNTMQDAVSAEAAEKGGQAIEQLSKLSESSKLKQYDPDKFKEFVRSVTEDSDLPNVYIDGKTFADALHQSSVDPTEIPGIQARLAEALKTGGDVQIPVEDYATHIAGTDLEKTILPNLKAVEGGMTYAEGQKFYQNEANEMQSRANDIATQQTKEVTQDTDVKAIGDKLLEQMRATERFPDDVSKASIAPVTEFYRTMAERTGMRPAELYEQFPLKVAGESHAGDLEQNERGAFSPDSNTIGLLKNADLSTFLHESGHFFLNTMGELAGREGAPQQIKDDMHTAIEWMGGKDLTDWQGKTLDQQRDMHEKFAKGFETYLMEGKAPTQAMQPLFARFRSWLMNVYKSISGLGVQLTPEVRGVFDRMLASDVSIKEAEQSRSYFPLDLSKTEATDKQQADYAALGQDATQEAVGELQARSIRDMKFAGNAKSKALKALQREAKEARATIQDEVTKEVMEQPAEKARAFIKENKVKKDSVSMDMVAEQFGISSGVELSKALEVSAKDQIANLTDQRMLERHGELTDPAAMQDAANAAVHNEVRAKFMATGLKLLAKSPVPARELARAATETAESTIAQKRVGDLNPRQYEVAETKANKEALALAPKDTAGAINAQRQALLSNRLAKAARDAMDQVKKIISGQARYDKDSIRSKMDPDILDQIDALRERFDFRQKPPNGPTRQEVQLQTWADSQKALGYSPLELADMMNPAVRMHYKDMTVEQLRGFNDTIRSLETIAKERKQVTVEGKKMDLVEVVNDLNAKMQAKPDKFTLEELLEPKRKGVDPLFSVALDRTKAFIRGAEAELKPIQFKINQFDQHEILGPFAKAIGNRVFDATYNKIRMLKEMSNYFGDGAQRLGKDWQDSLKELVPNDRLLDADLTKETGKPVYRRLTRGDMLGIARHVGNESNFDKLTKGMDWNPKDVWKFLHDNMTEKDWESRKIEGEAFEKHWPEVVAMNRRLGNTDPAKVELRPFMTKFGEMPGWYAPVDYDPIRSRLAEQKAKALAINPNDSSFDKNYFRADSTTNGSLNSRTNYVDRIDLDYHSVERRLHDTIHDLAYREALLDVNKIIIDPDFRKQFKQSYGPEQYASMQKWVGDLANGQNTDENVSKISAIMRVTRRMVVANGIALRISTLLKHGGSAGAKSMGYFSGGGEKYFASRMAATVAAEAKEGGAWLMSRVNLMGRQPNEQIASAIQKFPEIMARSLQVDRDYRQTSSSLYQPESIHSKAERFGHSMVAWSDLMSAVPTAWAAYDRAITDGIPTNRGGTGKPMTEEEAVHYANQVVREAHGSNIESARSMILQNNNEAVKMFTTLYGFMNNTLGQNLDMVDKLKTAGFSKPEVFSRWLMAMIVPALVAGAVAGKKKDEDWWKWSAGAVGGEYAGTIPFMREAWSMVHGYDSAGKPAYASVFGAVAKPFIDLSHAVQGKEVKAPIKDMGNALGLGIPGLGQIGTSMQYLADVNSGKEKPKDAVDVARGVALGQSNK